MADDLYVVEQKHPAGNYLAETNVVDTTDVATIHDLMHDQFGGRAVRVYKLTDVTTEFREKLQKEINRTSNGVIPSWLVTLMVG